MHLFVPIVNMGGSNSQELAQQKRQHVSEIKRLHKYYQTLLKTPPSDTPSDTPSEEGPIGYSMGAEDKERQKRFFDANNQLDHNAEAVWQCQQKKDGTPECIQHEKDRLTKIIECGGNVRHNGFGFSDRNPQQRTHKQFLDCLNK